MSNFVEQHLQFHRVDLLVLARDEDAGHSNQVQLRYLLRHLRFAVKLIHNGHCQEKGLLGTFVGLKHFDHPVNHFRSQRGEHLVIF